MNSGPQGQSRESSQQKVRNRHHQNTATRGASSTSPSPKHRPTEPNSRTAYSQRHAQGPLSYPNHQGTYAGSYLRMASPPIGANAPFMQSPHIMPSMVGDPYMAPYLLAAGPAQPGMPGTSNLGNQRPSRGRGRSTAQGKRRNDRDSSLLMTEQGLPDMSGLSLQEQPPGGFGMSSPHVYSGREMNPSAMNGLAEAMGFVHLPASAVPNTGPGGGPLVPPTFWDEELTLAGAEHMMPMGYAGFGPSPRMMPVSGASYYQAYGVPGYHGPTGHSYRGNGDAYASHSMGGFDANMMNMVPDVMYSSPQIGYQGFSRTANHRQRPPFTRVGELESRPAPARPAFGDLYRPPRSADRMNATMGLNTGPVSPEAVKSRSQLLEDYRNGTSTNLQLSELENHIVEFASDQHGSRLIQRKLEEATPEEKEKLFEELRPHTIELMTDVFGNYVIQKVFEHGTDEHKAILCDLLKGKVLSLTLQMYGCRAIQKAVEILRGNQQRDIVAELEGNVVRCVKDQNGNHVIQKCVECVGQEGIQFIVDAFRDQACGLSMHPYGCRVVQRILEYGNDEQVDFIMDQLHRFTLMLVQDQYGNYVMQHILEHGRPVDKEKIIDSMIGNVLLMSQHKFASNVVEKCLTYASASQRQAMIDEVMEEAEGEVSSLYLMTKDQYANYVVQKMIDIADEPVRQRFMELLTPYLPSLRRFTYGKHIISKVEKQAATATTTATDASTTATNAVGDGRQQTEQEDDFLENLTPDSLSTSDE